MVYVPAGTDIVPMCSGTGVISVVAGFAPLRHTLPQGTISGPPRWRPRNDGVLYLMVTVWPASVAVAGAGGLSNGFAGAWASEAVARTAVQAAVERTRRNMGTPFLNGL